MSSFGVASIGEGGATGMATTVITIDSMGLLWPLMALAIAI